MKATVLIPTHGDRAPLLPYSVGSVRGQSVREIEIFIIGDGVNDKTREVIGRLQREDPRIRFFDHPKDSRRGEGHRHEALKSARGRIIAYLCDRDLMLPDHIKVLDRLLRESNFAHTLTTQTLPDGRVMVYDKLNFSRPEDAALYLQPETTCGVGLSFVGHTREFYNRLPTGWATTPAGMPTDAFMWKKFLAHPDCRVAASEVPTILYFARNYSPYEKARDVAQWHRELRDWSERLGDPDWEARFQDAIRATRARPATGLLINLKRGLQRHRRLYVGAKKIPFLHRIFVKTQAGFLSPKVPPGKGTA